MRSLCIVSLLLAVGLGLSAAYAEPVEYRLGPEDKLQIKVFDWRTGSGEAYQWQALNGEFIVGSGGSLSLPLLGDIPANDMTPSAVANVIGERLQAKVGLAQRPDASVQVTKYRPFYIMGMVERQGEYDFRPDLSVLQAVSIAGGIARAGDGGAMGLERDAISGRGDLRALMVERTELLVRQARLDAEISGADSITLPPELASRQTEPAVARALREEQALFGTRRESLTSQSATLDQSRALLERQIVALAAKDVSLARQLAVTKQELDQISGLVSQGLAVLPRKLAIEENTAQYESSRLDVQLATLRAQQDISKAIRDKSELQAKDRNEALIEAAQVRARLGEVGQRLETARALVYQAEVREPAALAASTPTRPTPVYSIVRKVDGHATTLQVEDSDPVLPGDVVQVDFTDSDQTGPKHEAVGIAGRGPETAAVSN
ncbi:polysaccharide biosynthesis/export family protein [Lichenifustis flavocetrariae]|uniref:Polysaccharide export protein n=1 Tax=Lichenifustis flavocetrariae TaxID=2949735 RepID=A0AA41YVT9_9HYPH|nr:polysaccharide biosynthesis/export family protein [Lichenifustis flavocetrariae]MCW6509039.1 polysaccharide export protein [Lichenifustis flavocetrariae]